MRKLSLLGLATALAMLAVPATGAFAATPTYKAYLYDDFFRPASKTLVGKTKIKWTWKGENEHNVTLISAPSAIDEDDYDRYSSDTITEGSFSRTLKRVGKYRFVCTIHPDMIQKIKIKTPPSD